MVQLRKVNILLAAFFLLAPWVSAQELRITQPQAPSPAVKPPVATPKAATSVYKELSENKFRQQLIQAAVSAQKKNEISRLDLLRIRVASFSPALIKKAEDLAVIQMASSGEDGPFSVDDNGEIVRETIDWMGLAAFLEKLIPLILELIKVFGG
jgi:hypothetical protein